MNKFAPLFVVIAASLWGVDSIVLRPHLYTLPVPLVVFIESIIVAVLLIPIFIRKYSDLRNLKSMDLLAFGGVALFGGAIGTMAITTALFYVNYVNLFDRCSYPKTSTGLCFSACCNSPKREVTESVFYLGWICCGRCILYDLWIKYCQYGYRG